MKIDSIDNIVGSSKNSWLFIINPKAKRVNIDQICKDIQNLNSSIHPICYYFITEYKKHATEIAKSAIIKGVKTIIAVGGDGTINEIVNGIMTQNVIESKEINFGVIPAGTGNDWAKQYEFPHDISSCISILQNQKTIIQDVGKVKFKNGDKSETRYFNNVAGMAYDAFVVDQLEKKSYKPNRFIYLISVFFYLMKYKLQKAKIHADKRIFEHKYYTINIGICKYSGGGMSLVPHAVPDDGLLALTMAEDLSKLDILLNTYRFYNHSLLEHPKVHGLQVQSIEVDSTNEIPIQLEVDGELLGTTPASFSIIHKCLKVIIP